MSESKIVTIEVIKACKIGKIPCKVGQKVNVDSEAAKIYIKHKLAKESDERPTARDVVSLIEKVEKLEDLKQYESDERQHVVAAYNKKLKELSK
jgi:RNase H-fold protein (predicted Holliday junction resolvase)